MTYINENHGNSSSGSSSSTANSSSSSLTVDNILQSLHGLKPQFSNFFNIVIFGEAGVGKSSLINALKSVMSGSVTPVAKVKDEEEDHTTVTFDRYMLTDSIALFDTWGWSVDHANYRNEEYQAILQGVLQLGHHMDESPFLQNQNKEKKRNFQPADLAADVMLFVIDASTTDDERITRTVVEMRKFLEQAMAQRRVGPISFVLTKVDKVDGLTEVVFEENVGVALSKIGRNKRVNHIIQLIKRTLPNEMRKRVTFNTMINLEINERFISPVIDVNIRNFLLELFKPIFQSLETSHGSSSGKHSGFTTTPHIEWKPFDFFDGETQHVVAFEAS